MATPPPRALRDATSPRSSRNSPRTRLHNTTTCSSTALARDKVFFQKVTYDAGVQSPKTPVTSMFSK